jgi:arabinan endo-1,5-alpha-L-arabinosidase
MKTFPGFQMGALLVLGLMAAGSRGSAQERLALAVAPPNHRDVITGSLTYTFSVTNLSALPVFDVRMDDTLPASAQFLSATNAYTLSSTISTSATNVVFSIPRINGSDTAQMTLTVLPTAVGLITNRVSLSAAGMTQGMVAESVIAVPSIQVSIHDPAMAKAGDTYYLFSSGPGITFYSSKDMKNWELRGRVFPGEPGWARKVASRFDGHIWAPDIVQHDGRYYLYYAVSSPAQNSSAIGVTINKTLDPDSPEYQWEDHGIVLQSVPGRDLWNAIDPNIITDETGAAWMDFGSFWSGIKLVKLDSSWTALADTHEWYSLARRERSSYVDDRTPGPAQIEGPFIFKKGDYYYLFVSWGLCCRGKDSTYKIMMGRSKHLIGPYLDRKGDNMAYGAGSLLLGGDRDWPGRGGNSVYTFDGKDYIVFHAYEAADNGLQKLMIAELKWDATQWPVVDEQSLNHYRSAVVKAHGPDLVLMRRSPAPEEAAIDGQKQQ